MARRRPDWLGAAHKPQLTPPPDPVQVAMPGMSTSEAVEMVAKAIERSKNPSKNKQWEDKLDFQFRSFELPPFTRQFVLVRRDQSDPRKDGKPRVWKFDFCFEQFKLIVEFDGGVWMPGGGAHSHPVDIERNTDKRNDASIAGYWVMAFTDRHVRSGVALAETQAKLCTLGWRPTDD